jgi:cytochrome c oxidase cbb3-type subunit 1
MSAVLEAKQPARPAQILKETDEEFATRIEVDRSCRGPVLFFFTTGLLWLLLGTLFGFLASFKMHSPELLADYPWLTWGRVRMAHLNAVIYGWASLSGIGVAIWLMGRLCRQRLQGVPICIAAGVLWNLAVAIGIVGILAGHSTSVEWLEFPGYAVPPLVVGFVLVSIWGVIMFRKRRPGHVYVSQWYLFAALFWFPWLYSTAQLIIQHLPIRGVVIGAVNWWYGHNVLGLWFTPIGLAAAYYFIPKVIGRPVHSYYLSALGFWTLALFYSWNGMHHLIGGPYPAWLITASVVASMMMIIPVLTVAINHHMTMRGNFHMLAVSPTLRFVVFGAMAYTLVSLQGILMAFRSFNKITHFTHYTVGHSHLGLYAFYTMIIFGAMYYIVPRLVGCEWRWPSMIKLHFWLAAYGILVMVGVLTVAGFAQGAALLNLDYTFMDTVNLTKPYLVARSFSGVALAVAHFVFFGHFMMMLFGRGRKPGSPTYFTTSEQEEARA